MTQTSHDDVVLLQDALPDEELLAAVRGGETGAYAMLYRRHLAAALALAGRLAGAHEGQDVAQEAFLKVLRAILGGGGPREGFAPYLMRAVRNEAIDRLRRSREAAVEDIEAWEPPVSAGAGAEPLNHELVSKAFSTLPPQWQRILWLTEVDGLAPRELALQLHRSPSAVAQLSRRAREGLRSAWLQAHVDGAAVGPECRQTAGELGAYERGQLSATGAERTSAHLEDCVRCSLALRELQALSTRMRGMLLPIVLGSPMLLEELSELLPLADQHAVLEAMPEVAAGGGEAGGAIRPLSWGRLSAAGLGLPVAAAGVAVLVGAAGLVLLSQRPGSDREALPPVLEEVEADAVGAVPLDAEDPVETTSPTSVPMLVEEGEEPGAAGGEAAESIAGQGEQPASGSGAAAGGTTAPASTPGGADGSAHPIPATAPDASPASDAGPATGAPAPGGAPAGETPATGETPRTGERPPAGETPSGPGGPLAPIDHPAPVGNSPSDSIEEPATKPEAPELPPPPLLGETGPALPPVFPPETPTEPAPPSEEPAEGSAP